MYVRVNRGEFKVKSNKAQIRKAKANNKIRAHISMGKRMTDQAIFKL